MNFWCLARPHIAPLRHAMINAHANPVVPSHIPPTPINFMSPMPIGMSAFGLWRRIRQSNVKPIIDAIRYPNVAPVTASEIDVGKLKNVININPISINGNKKASGIIRVRKSVMEIMVAHITAHSNKIVKKI